MKRMTNILVLKTSTLKVCLQYETSSQILLSTFSCTNRPLTRTTLPELCSKNVTESTPCSRNETHHSKAKSALLATHLALQSCSTSSANNPVLVPNLEEALPRAIARACIHSSSISPWRTSMHLGLPLASSKCSKVEPLLREVNHPMLLSPQRRLMMKEILEGIHSWVQAHQDPARLSALLLSTSQLRHQHALTCTTSSIRRIQLRTGLNHSSHQPWLLSNRSLYLIPRRVSLARPLGKVLPGLVPELAKV